MNDKWPEKKHYTEWEKNTPEGIYRSGYNQAIDDLMIDLMKIINKQDTGQKLPPNTTDWNKGGKMATDYLNNETWQKRYAREFDKAYRGILLESDIKESIKWNIDFINKWVTSAKQRRDISSLEINNILLHNATGCKDVNAHHGIGKIEKGCTMCWAQAIHDAIQKGE